MTFDFIADNPSMVDVYWNIFNAMAAIIKHQSYIDLLRLTFLMGGFAAFVFGVIKSVAEERSPKFLKYFFGYTITVTVLLILFLGETAKVKIEAVPQTQPFCSTASIPIGADDHKLPGAVVGGVPKVMAFIFSSANTIGRKLEDISRSAFTDPVAGLTERNPANSIMAIKKILEYTGDNLYAEVPLGSGSSSKKIRFNDLFSTIFTQCVILPAGADFNNGDKVIKTFSTTGNPSKTLVDFVKRGDLNFYKNPTSAPETKISNFRFDDSLPPKEKLASLFGSEYTCGSLINSYERALSEISSSGAISCDQHLLDAMNASTIALLTGGSVTPNRAIAEQIALNAGLLSQVMAKDSGVAAGEIPYNAGYSMAEMAVKNYGQGIYLSQVLPYVQAGLRAIIYSLFPFIFVIVILPGGLRVLSDYVKTIIWVELWTPLMILMGMFLSFQTAEIFKKFYNEAGFNALNGFQVFTDTMAAAGVAGYLFAMIPGLAWLMIKGTMSLIGGFTEGIATKFKVNLMGDDLSTSKTYARAMIDKGAESVDIEKAIARNSVASRALIASAMMEATGNEKSFSEISYGQSLFQGAETAGRFMAYREVGNELLKKAEQGKRLNKIASGVGQNEAFHKGEAVKENIEGFAEKAKFDTLKSIESGKILEKMQPKEVDNLAQGTATSSLSEDMATQKTIDKVGVERFVNTKAYEETAKTIKQDELSRNMDAETFGKIKGSKELMDIKEAKGEVDVLGGNTGNIKRVMDISEAAGEKKGAETAGKAEAFESAGAEKIVEAKKNLLISSIGEGLATDKKISSQMQGAGIKSEGNLLLDAGKMSVAGAAGMGMKKAVGDETSDAANFFDMNAKDLASTDSAESLEKKAFIEEYGKGSYLNYAKTRGERLGKIKEWSSTANFFEVNLLRHSDEALFKAGAAKDYGEVEGNKRLMTYGQYHALQSVLGDNMGLYEAVGVIKGASTGLPGMYLRYRRSLDRIEKYLDKAEDGIIKKTVKVAYKPLKAVDKMMGIGTKFLGAGAAAAATTAFFSAKNFYDENKETIDRVVESEEYKKALDFLNSGNIAKAKKTLDAVYKKYGNEIAAIEHGALKVASDSALAYTANSVAFDLAISGATAGASMGGLAAAGLIYTANKNMEASLKQRKEASSFLSSSRKSKKDFIKAMESQNVKTADLKLDENTAVRFDKESGEWKLVDLKRNEDIAKISDDLAAKTYMYATDLSIERMQAAGGSTVALGKEIEKLKDVLAKYDKMRERGFDKAVLKNDLVKDIENIVERDGTFKGLYKSVKSELNSVAGIFESAASLFRTGVNAPTVETKSRQREKGSIESQGMVKNKNNALKNRKDPEDKNENKNLPRE